MMSRTVYSTAKEDPTYWFLETFVEDDYGRTFWWAFSRDYNKGLMHIDVLSPRHQLADISEWFDEVTTERNWG